MSKFLTQVVFVSCGVALAQLSAVAVAQERTASIKLESNAGRALAAPATMSREARLAARPLDSSVTMGRPTPRQLSADERAALQAAKPAVSDAGAPSASADDEARRDFSEEWKAMDQQDR